MLLLRNRLLLGLCVAVVFALAAIAQQRPAPPASFEIFSCDGVGSEEGHNRTRARRTATNQGWDTSG